MLRKLYLVSADGLNRDKRTSLERMKKRKHQLYEEWIKMRQTMGEADISQRTKTKAIADFLRRVMPKSSSLSRPPKNPNKTRAAGRSRS